MIPKARPKKHRPIRTILIFFIPILISILASLFLVSRSSSRLSLLKAHFRSFPPPTTRMSTSSYEKELNIALLSVQRATILTQKVFHEKVKGIELKSDKSPVTIGDYGAQALIISAIKHAFPQDDIVGEEDSSTLKETENLRQQVWNAVKTTHLPLGEDALGGPIPDEASMLSAIDNGNSTGGSKGRIWALDPIDGTKGFLRGGQYAVCLALIVDGEIQVGVLGCPNLPVSDTAPLSAGIDDSVERGVLFAAVKGQGATSRPLARSEPGNVKAISMRTPEVKEATFCESVEAGHSSHGDQATIAKKLGITKPSVRMDSQSKYGSIARGAGDIYLRLPVNATYEEKIWDHAAGALIVEEAGGVVSDVKGQKLDFSVGRTLKNNKGIVAAPKALHPEVLKAVKEILEQK